MHAAACKIFVTKNYCCTLTVVVACLSPPPRVLQSNWNIVVDAITELVATPFTLVLEELREVKSGWSGLEMMQDCMPVVSHERREVPCGGTVLGLATRMILGRPTCTEHWAPEVLPLSVQERV